MENQLTEQEADSINEELVKSQIKEIQKDRIVIMLNLPIPIAAILKQEAQRLNYTRKSYCERVLIEKSEVLQRLGTDVKEFLESENNENEK